MFQTTGIQTVASITELRSKTASLIEHVQKSGAGVLIQRNNEPQAVLLSYEQYMDLVTGGDRRINMDSPQTDSRTTNSRTSKAVTTKKPRPATKK